MTGPDLDLRRPGAPVLVWAAGVAALLGMIVYSQLTATPYPTSWPWITFAAMAILEVAVFAPAGSGASAGTRVVLLAAMIMFRKHPDITAIVTAAAGLGGGLLARLPWRTVVTRSAWLLIFAAGGTASLRLVGYQDTPHFLAATALLILLYVGGLLAIHGPRSWPVRDLAAALLGALLALGWRTPASGPLMLRLGEVAILALIGLVVGSAMGGRPRELLRRRVQLRGIPVLPIVGGVGLVVSTRMGGQVSTVLAVAGVGMIGLYAAVRQWFPLACIVLGAMGNELARLANDGRMPVDTNGLPAAIVDELGNLDQTSIYQAVNSTTHLAWLADRFPLAPFPGVASPGDVVIALGIVWLFASLTMSGRSPAATDSVPGRIAA